MLKNNIVAAGILKAMANKYRIQIVAHLMGGEQTVSQLNEVVTVSQPALSQHLNKLRREGILARRSEGKQRYYYIDDTHVLRIMGIVAEMVEARTKGRKIAA